jgi:tripartite-type tricarboxylate transporter receptor subunit TctC
LPDTPTLNEAGLPGFELNIWYGLYAPKGTPKPVIDKLSATLQEALKDDKLKARFAQGNRISNLSEDFGEECVLPSGPLDLDAQGAL